MAKENKITISEYLSSYSAKRNIDSAFIKWFRKKDIHNPKKEKTEWDNLYKEFLNLKDV